MGTARCSNCSSTAPLLHFAAGQHGPHLLPRPLIAFGRIGAARHGVEGRRGRRQQVEQALLDAAAGFRLHVLAFLFPHQADGVFDQLADHALHVAAVVAHLGVLRGLDLDEGGAGQLGQPAGDLGLADAGGADHHDVLGGHLLAHVAFELLAAPAVADGDGHGPLRRVLSDDVPIEFGHDLPRRQVSHSVFLRSARPSQGIIGLESTLGLGGNQEPRTRECCCPRCDNR